MDINFLNFIWAILGVPISWLYTSWKEQKKEIASLNTKNAEICKDLKSLKEKIDPLSNDLRVLTTTINEVNLNMERKLYSVALESLQHQNRKE